MLNRYARQGSGLLNLSNTALSDTLWIDLFEPTPEEQRAVEAECRVDVLTHEEMREIETSSHLFEEDGAV